MTKKKILNKIETNCKYYKNINQSSVMKSPSKPVFIPGKPSPIFVGYVNRLP